MSGTRRPFGGWSELEDMVRTYRSRSVARTIAALAGASVLLAACGGGSDTGGSTSGGGGGGGEEASEGSSVGVTDTSIKIGTHMPLTGPAAPGYSEIPVGTKAYFDYVNAAGGVNGREIEYVFRDDTYNPATTSTVVNQLVLQDEVFGVMGGLGTPTHSAVIDFLNEEEVPDLFVNSGALAWDNPADYPYTFGWQPDYEVEGKILGKYISEEFPDAKVGLFLQGDDFGRDGAKGAKMFLEEQIVAEESYTPGNTDVGPQIAKLQASGADLVIGFNVPAYTALSQLVALKLNYKTQWFYSNVAFDATLVGGLLARFSEGAVADASPLAGVHTTKYVPTLEDEGNPWIELFSQVWEEHGDGKPLSNFGLIGMYQAYTTVAALQAAGEDLTREGVVAALEESGSDFEGPWLAPMEYSAETHRGISGLSVVQFNGTGYDEVAPMQTTDADDAEIELYEEEPSVPTEDGLPDAG
jgi:ABC-type branched-subunit amino acid transport system substrate-binding protein